jgi:hypothetical protein
VRKTRAISVLFTIAALYDGLLGLAFLFAAGPLFRWYDVTPPNHIGYVQFPAMLLIIFALMFAAVARRPVRNRNLILYGILLKASYSGVVFLHWFTAGIPDMWKPFAICDLIFMVLFVWAWGRLAKQASHQAPEAT